MTNDREFTPLGAGRNNASAGALRTVYDSLSGPQPYLPTPLLID
jgi:hypothetical protein